MRGLFSTALYLLFISILIIYSSCEEDESPMDKLPPATREGLGTFGCLVNREAWTPEGYTGISNLDISYDPRWQQGSFDIATYRILSKENQQFIHIYSIGVDKVGTYELNNVDQGAATLDHSLGCSYNRDPSTFREGSLTITKLDLNKRIISGTFEFTLAKPECDTIKVAEGRFDMKI